MNRNTSLLLALAAVTGLSACGERAEEKAPENETVTAAEESAAPEEPAVQPDELIWVFRARGSRQCEGGGMSLEESGANLTDNGVVVQESSCGSRTDRMYAAVCGGPTGDILLHLIEEGSLDAALELGFDPADQIKYEKGDCPKNNN
ncbi:hypothetical protein [Microbulbifer marinus]|uniref:Lipoprotein n=1 Tax=Microbulbifer marinus TaxID=658218 RepID=A0A1H3WLX0_9GAMM|nr:hypothetical protein [Microbulbifer marinus]SDZ88167.1 hypothetical protein SAMN05216562_0972 [Microbulbifer marinus]